MSHEWVVKSRLSDRVLIGFAERADAVRHAESLNVGYQTDEYVVDAWRVDQ